MPVLTGLLASFLIAQIAGGLEPAQGRSLAALRKELAGAQQREDLDEVRRLAREAARILGPQAGEPEVPDTYQRPPDEVAPLTREEAVSLFARLEQHVGERRWWRPGLDPTATEHLPREVASVIQGCLAGVRAGVPNRDGLLQQAREAGDYLVWTQEQAGGGVIPFPAFRGGRGAAFEAAERFLARADREGANQRVLRGGWVIDDLGDGGLQFDNGRCGIALLELHAATGGEAYRRAGLAAADWAAGRPAVPNWNYNSFSLGLLARAYRASREARYLEGAVRKLELGVLPGQLVEGARQGRWADPHNARPAYHYIMCQHLAELMEVMPEQHPARGELTACLSRALRARNEEILTRGVMNRDSALEAIVDAARLDEKARGELGDCLVPQALAALERLVTEEPRRGRMSLAPGALGRFLEYRLTRGDN